MASLPSTSSSRRTAKALVALAVLAVAGGWLAFSMLSKPQEQEAPAAVAPVASVPVDERTRRDKTEDLPFEVKERIEADARVMDRLSRDAAAGSVLPDPARLLSEDTRRRLAQDALYRDWIKTLAVTFNEDGKRMDEPRAGGLYRLERLTADETLPVLRKHLRILTRDGLSREEIERLKTHEREEDCTVFGDLLEEGYVVLYDVYFKNPYKPPVHFKSDVGDCRRDESQFLNLPTLTP